MTSRKGMNISVILLSLALSLSVGCFPAPLYYTERSPINLTIDLSQVKAISSEMQFSPDLSSVVYGRWDLMYRPSIWSEMDTKIQFVYIAPLYAFDPTGNYLYVVNIQSLTNESISLKLGAYTVNNNMVNTNYHQYCTIIQNDTFTGFYDMVRVSTFGSIAIQIYMTIYIVLVNPENDSAYLYDQIHITTSNWPLDMKWHPTEKETLFVCSLYGFYRYNLTAKYATKIDSKPCISLVFLLGGSLVLTGND
jgi:hypothetical protein